MATRGSGAVTFLRGERISLCVPHADDLEEWSSWFNSPEITRYLEQGMRPNTVEDQAEFLQQAGLTGRFIATVRSNEASELLGVVSLSTIDHYRQSAQMAHVVPKRCPSAPHAALEATALITEHGFRRMRLMRIWAGQSYPGLASWNAKLELIGYRTEGLHRDAFVHGQIVTDSVTIAVTLSEFDRLTERRGGNLWPGSGAVDRMLAHRTRARYEPITERLKQALDECYRDSARALVEAEATDLDTMGTATQEHDGRPS